MAHHPHLNSSYCLLIDLSENNPDLDHSTELTVLTADHAILKTEQPCLRLEKKSEFLHLIFYYYTISFW